MPTNEEIAQQQALLQTHRRRLHELNKQKATFGSRTDPHITIEIDDIRAAIAAIEQKLHGWGVSVYPAHEGWLLAHPYAMLPNFTGRIAERDMLTAWLEQDTQHPLLVVKALGGFGKSALTWHWLMSDVAPDRWPRAVWWSFYETQATAENFIVHTLRYLGRDPNSYRSGQEAVMSLLHLLRAPGTLLVLDGFERALRAYHSLNAAYQGDADATPPGYDSRGCVSPLADDLLRHLSVRSDLRGKVLMTTRMRPAAIETRDELLVAAREHPLTALSLDDGVAFFRAAVIHGGRAEIERACRAYDCHPLSLRLLVGLCRRDLHQPGDIAAVDGLDISGDLVQRQHHVLEQSYATLDAAAQQWLRRIACFREPVAYAVLAVLAGSEAGGEEARSEEQKPSWFARLFGKPRPRSEQAQPAASPLDASLNTLVARGLVQRDPRSARFDLHPIVRRYAYERMGGGERSTTHDHLRGYFAALEAPGSVERMEELAEQIELYHHTLRAGLYDEAWQLFSDRLNHALYYQFGAYELRIELLRALFPDGEDKPPRLKDEGDHAWTLAALANSYSLAGHPRRAIPLLEQGNAIRERRGDKKNLAIGLGNLAYMAQLHVGALRAAEANLRRRIALCREIADEFREVVGHQELGRVLAYRGAWDEAEEELAAALALFEKVGHVQGQGIVWSHRALRWLLLARAGAAGDPAAEALAAAQRALDKAEARTQYPLERDYVRAHWLLGAAHLAGGALEAAAPRLEEALTRCRTINMVDHEADILLSLAQLRAAQGGAEEARRLAEDALLITERSGYVLQGADVRLFLAQQVRAAGDTAAAREHAREARRLATCDGPPDYTYRVAYAAAGALLEAGSGERGAGS